MMLCISTMFFDSTIIYINREYSVINIIPKDLRNIVNKKSIRKVQNINFG